MWTHPSESFKRLWATQPTNRAQSVAIAKREHARHASSESKPAERAWKWGMLTRREEGGGVGERSIGDPRDAASAGRWQPAGSVKRVHLLQYRTERDGFWRDELRFM